MAPQPRRYRRRPGPRLMAPLRIDLGAHRRRVRFGTLGGAERRSASTGRRCRPTPTDFDIGIGAFGGC
jgi:hypothetical protein